MERSPSIQPRSSAKIIYPFSSKNSFVPFVPLVPFCGRLFFLHIFMAEIEIYFQLGYTAAPC
jgi:hypothetical protein